MPGPIIFRAPHANGRIASSKKAIWGFAALICCLTGMVGLQAGAQSLLPTRSAELQPAAAAGKAQGPSPAVHALDKADVDAWLDGFMLPQLQRGDIAGAVVMVVKDGQILTQRGYGYPDMKTRRPVDPETTLFRVGSVSKLFTWTAVMQQVEQGRLDLDADVNRYLDFKIPPYQGKPITLRNIMTHSTGFEERIRKLDQPDIVPPPLGDVLKEWVPHRIFAPGEVPAYSNYASSVAGYIVQRVSGEPFDTYIQRHIFAPLGIVRASFQQPLPPALKPYVSSGYQTASEGAKPYEVIALAPAGSLAISGVDMAKFLNAHLQNGGPLLRPDTARLMHTGSPSLLPRISHMALGFYTEDANGHRVIAHAGDTRFMHSDATLFLDDKVGLFISLNSAGRAGAAGPIRSLLFKQFADRYFPGPEPDGHIDAATAKRHARMMAGYYLPSRRPQSSFLFALTMLGQQKIVPTDKGTLKLIPDRAVGGGSREWVEIAPFLWRASDSGDLLEARVVNGRVERFGTTAVSVMQPVPWTMSAGWLVPALQFSALIVLVTALSWPISAVARRVYHSPLALEGLDRRAYHGVRAAALVSLLVVLGWAYLFLVGYPSYRLFNGEMDWIVRLLQVLTPLAFLTLLIGGAWTVWKSWTGGSRWLAKIWSILFLLAAVMAWWGAIALNLIGFANEY